VSRYRVLVAAAAALVAVAAIPGAQAAGRGCSSGNTYARGDAHRVYAIPHGCTWLYRPDGHFFSIGPEVHTRINGATDGEALPRDPIGDAAAVCGFTTFVVSWPRFVVSARRVFWGQGATACETLSANRSVRWEGRFVWRPRNALRPARWEPVLLLSSPPLRHN
jgi:hypothetical protein